METPSWPWYRYFIRKTVLDEDRIPGQDFIDQNFKDFFGKTWLPANAHLLTFDQVLRYFWDGSRADPPRNTFAIYCVSDGGRFEVSNDNDWLNQHTRFVAWVAGNKDGSSPPFADTDPNSSWTLCIVGSEELTSTTRFLQVASWDTKVFRFYERNEIQNGSDPPAHGWIYMGASDDAFKDNASYLGPFNGHVNGSVLMKELRAPWPHWMTTDTDFVANFPERVKAGFSKELAPYLTSGSTCSRVDTPDKMMTLVENGVSKWTANRAAAQFKDEKGKPRGKIESGLKRWLAHVLLSTTVNIGVGSRDFDTKNNLLLPPNHVFNSELYKATSNLSKIFPPPPTKLSFSKTNYKAAAGKVLQVCTIQDVSVVPPGRIRIDLPADTSLAAGNVKEGLQPVVAAAVELGSEGEGLEFTTIQPSWEDAKGVYEILNQEIPVLSTLAYNALVMVDAWNPVYSWRRGVLLQYVPDDATLDPTKGTYNLEALFVAKVKASARLKDSNSPEQEFLDNYCKDKQKSFPGRMTAFFENIKSKLQTEQGVVDYMRLAESRRRLYRPLPLDEFALTLPYALLYEQGKYYEMLEDGNIQEVPIRGVNFFNSWRTSVSGYDPRIIPTPDANASDIAVQKIGTTTPPVSHLLESTPAKRTKRRGGCPAMQSFRVQASLDNKSPRTPTWEDDIKVLFEAPFWLPEDKRSAVGKGWIGAMKHYGAQMPDGKNLTLNNYDHVRLQAKTIYEHCASRSMPITSDPNEYWPQEALDTFLLWMNQGCRQSKSDALLQQTLPMAGIDTPVFRTRQDVRDLTAQEVQIYRAKMQDILRVDFLDSKWQELGELHAWWCLHYQEATFPWHRCWLKYIETLIDFPIPYWNVVAEDSVDPQSPHAGIPQIFLDDTYILPNGTVGPNPLKYAQAYKGRSKNGKSSFVQRNPILTKGRPSSPGPELDEWNKEIAFLNTYHSQIIKAMTTDKFSSPQGIGLAWAALPEFTKDMPDDAYSSQQSFDGWFEQVHDNLHGWIGGPGGDMSDNTYTAFDPIFLSYHANMDRLFEKYLKSKPNLHVTGPNFPLKPFLKDAVDLNFTDPNNWKYATIGEMVKDTASHGYVYAPPASPDIKLPDASESPPQPSGGTTMNLIQLASVKEEMEKAPSANKGTPYIAFKDVVCTDDSYEIDVFLSNAISMVPDPVSNPGFVGRLFRMGMGRPNDLDEVKNRGRCRSSPVVRVIEAEAVADRIEKGFLQIVKRIDPTGPQEVPEKEWRTMKGFAGELVWVK